MVVLTKRKVTGGYDATFHDRGCVLHPRCLECPRTRCIEDTRPQLNRSELSQAAMVAFNMVNKGHGKEVVARKLKKSIRTIERYMQIVRESQSAGD
jgi:hypothetical protein